MLILSSLLRKIISDRQVGIKVRPAGAILDQRLNSLNTTQRRSHSKRSLNRMRFKRHNIQRVRTLNQSRKDQSQLKKNSILKMNFRNPWWNKPITRLSEPPHPRTSKSVLTAVIRTKMLLTRSLMRMTWRLTAINTRNQSKMTPSWIWRTYRDYRSL